MSASAARRSSVLQVVLSLGSGGTERLVIDIASRLHPEFAMAVCCLDEPGSGAQELVARGITVTALGRSPGFRPSTAYGIASLVRRYRADIVHCHHYSPFVYGRLATLVSPRTRLVFTEHGRLSDAPPSAKRQLVNPVLGRLPGSICAVSEDLRRHMIAEGLPARRIGVVHNGIAPGPLSTIADRRTARQRLDIGDRALVVGTAARLDPVKSLDTLIDAFAAARSLYPTAELVIMGDGPERARLERVAVDAGVRQAVHFTGHRPDVRQLLPALDVYVNSSTTEGVSLTILEAMAASLPVIATRVGGNPEVVMHGETGLLVPPRSAGELARALAALASAPQRRRFMGQAGRFRTEQHFTFERMVDHYARIYRGMERN